MHAHRTLHSQYALPVPSSTAGVASVVPDFTPEEYARFDANDRAAERAAECAAAACGQAGPFPATPAVLPDLGELPF